MAMKAATFQYWVLNALSLCIFGNVGGHFQSDPTLNFEGRHKASRIQASLMYTTNPTWAPILQQQYMTNALVSQIELF